MRLINPGLGELSDRYSILALKILFGQDAGKDIAHFLKERHAIREQLYKRLVRPDQQDQWREDYSGLAAVNAALWHAEDDLRVLRGREAKDHEDETFYLEASRCGFRIQSLNDRRAVVIEKINREAGEMGGAEKL